MPTPTNLLLAASAARTADFNTDDQFNYAGHRGLQVIIDVTASASPAFTVTIQGKDPISGKYYTLLASASITGNGTTILEVYPGLLAAANTIANKNLPLVWRLSIDHTNANSATYSIAANMLP